MVNLRKSTRSLVLRQFRYVFPARLAEFCVHLASLSSVSRFLWQHRSARSFAGRGELHSHVIKTEDLDAPIDFLEFGVSRGWSMGWWLKNVTCPEASFVGFDTFTGIPEKWGRHQAGAFTANGKQPTLVDPRLEFKVGMFQETLPQFLENNELKRRLVVHLDADLYSSTLSVLANLHSKLKCGDILLFDELGGVTTAAHEFRAFDDFCRAFPFNYEVLGTAADGAQLALKVLDQ